MNKNFPMTIMVDGKMYRLYEVTDIDSISSFYEWSMLFPHSDIFLFNSFGNLVSFYQNHAYTLLCITNNSFSNHFLMNPIFLPFKISCTWYSSWIQKLDYILDYYSTIKGKFPIIDESISYYVSLFEYSIYLVRDSSFYSDFASIQHSIFQIDSYFNPLSFKLDIKERDFAEYLKYLFFHHLENSIDLISIIQKGKNIFNYDYVVARLIFPNYYFDLFDNIVLSKESISSMKPILSRQDEYNFYVKKIIHEISKFHPIKKVPF